MNTTVPVLLISGVADPVAGKDMTDKYRQLAPEADVIEINEIGHYPHVEDPKDVLRYYRTFVASLKQQ